MLWVVIVWGVIINSYISVLECASLNYLYIFVNFYANKSIKKCEHVVIYLKFLYKIIVDQIVFEIYFKNTIAALKKFRSDTEVIYF